MGYCVDCKHFKYRRSIFTKMPAQLGHCLCVRKDTMNIDQVTGKCIPRFAHAVNMRTHICGGNYFEARLEQESIIRRIIQRIKRHG